MLLDSFFRIEQDKAIFLGIGYHALYRIQHFCIILPGDDRIHIASLVAELPDAADDLQMECVFIDITLRRGRIMPIVLENASTGSVSKLGT